MLFTYSLTVPPLTPKSAPVRKTLKLHAGFVKYISILIPSGHACTAHLAIFDGETQIIPWGDEQYIEGDDETLTWAVDYLLPTEPAVLEARAWSEDDTYEHTFYIRVFVNETKSEPDWQVLEEGAKAISAFVKRVLGV